MDVIADIEDQTGVAFSPEKGNVEFVGPGNSTEHFVSLFKYLIKNEYISRQDIPISAEQAQHRYILNSEPSHQGRDMIRPQELADNFYLETNHDTSSKKRYAKKVIKEFALS